MSNWQADQYLRFEEERTRPCRDLASSIRIDNVRDVIDLGCGPGNSTAVLAERWPAARVTGLDSSPDMLRKARQSNPQQELVASDIADWAKHTAGVYDVVFSNAALQWVQDHATVYPQIMARVAPGGVLAVQVPGNIDAPAHRIMRDLASSNTWRDRFPADGVREWFVHDAPFYYDLLSPLTTRLNIWVTTYIHVLPGAEAITEWYRGTGLLPFLQCLHSEEERGEFLRDYTTAIRAEYRPRADGQVLFPFRRLFIIAHKPPAN